MIDIKTTKMTGRPVVATCLGASRFRATGLPSANFGAGLAGLSGETFGGFNSGDSISSDRPTKATAPAAAKAAAGVRAYAARSAAVAAGEGLAARGIETAAASRKDSANQKHLTIQHLTMWAFRGPKPWRDPA